MTREREREREERRGGQRECDRREGRGREPGERKGGRGGGKGVRAEGRGEARGRKAREEARSLSRLSAARGAQTPPFRAAQLSLCRGRWRGAGGKEGRSGAVGRGGYSISGRRIGCIQSQSGCKLGPWPGRVGCKGSAAGGWGVDRKRRGEGLERGHLLQLSPRQLGAFAQTTPASSSWQLLSTAPSHMEPPTPIHPSTLLSHASSVQRGTKKSQSLHKLRASS
ncbi:uncharacterized protein LOC113904014 [Bos indicus x Bos taurus]|uniref:uncharacterized protein LOC113904014 n=1 Tax=Bos indicus x Bos taurus TaxID=30522 RepID=UPI000F7D13CB|nr:uncharacterized protein LOC113904014 [Bos indicus x Bos taurus]